MAPKTTLATRQASKIQLQVMLHFTQILVDIIMPLLEQLH